MKSKKKQSIFNKISFTYFFVVLICLFSLVTFASSIVTYADDSGYSDVLEDLQKDESFDINDYPVVGGDYSLDVIQIAESTNDELFVYVYQPSGGLVASSINISKTIGDDLNYINYSLTLINSESTIFKYKVNDFELRSELIRYYDISSIYRPFNSDLDSSLLEDNGNTISEVAYPVARLWTVSTVAGEVSYSSTDTEVVEITDKYVGFLRYMENVSTSGYNLYDNHFVAFNTNYPIDKLVSAEIYFQTQDHTVEGNPLGDVLNPVKIELSEPVSHHEIINADDKVVINSNVFFVKNQYEWSKIQTISEFLETENRENIYNAGILDVETVTKITDEGLIDLEGMQWVLRFVNTEHYMTRAGVYTYAKDTRVTDVSILRLEFEVDGITYNLGVVDNKQTGDGIPDNYTNINFSINWWGWLLIAIVIIVLIAIFAPTILVAITTFIFKAIGYLLKGIWWLIKLPFKLFKKE